jgi:hypothetical protein
MISTLGNNLMALPVLALSVDVLLRTLGQPEAVPNTYSLSLLSLTSILLLAKMGGRK